MNRFVIKIHKTLIMYVRILCFSRSISPANNSRRRHYAVSPSVDTYFACHDIPLLGGDISNSIKLGTNAQRVSGHCWKVYKVRDQRSRSLPHWMHIFRLCGVGGFDIPAHFVLFYAINDTLT